MKHSFSQKFIFKRKCETLLFFTVNVIILSYIHKFINSSSRSEDMKIFFFNISNFRQLFGFFDIFLLQSNQDSQQE